MPADDPTKIRNVAIIGQGGVGKTLVADALLFARPEYRQELADLIGSGAFGTPWLLAIIGRFAVAHLVSASRVAAADHRALESAAAISIISAQSESREAQVRAGQVLQRLYLEATLRGLCLQPVSQPLEADETREAVASLLPDPRWHPLQPFRLGYGTPPRTRSPRRPLEDVLASLPMVFGELNSMVSNGATGTSSVDLRSLGGWRTLTLVNGRRLGAGAPLTDQSDTNQIPSALIRRVEILTGGASAICGCGSSICTSRPVTRPSLTSCAT